MVSSFPMAASILWAHNREVPWNLLDPLFKKDSPPVLVHYSLRNEAENYPDDENTGHINSSLKPLPYPYYLSKSWYKSLKAWYTEYIIWRPIPESFDIKVFQNQDKKFESVHWNWISLILLDQSYIILFEMNRSYKLITRNATLPDCLSKSWCRPSKVECTFWKFEIHFQ